MYSNEYHEEFYLEADYRLPDTLQTILDLKPGRILDVGCGNGLLLRELSKHGFDCVGVEFDRQYVQALSERDCKVHFLTAKDLRATPDERFDIIHFGDVLEHLPDPVETLTAMLGMLNPAGLVVVGGPLENNPHLSLWFRKVYSLLRGSKRSATHRPYHLSLSNKRSQLALFDLVGLERTYFSIREDHWPLPNRPGTEAWSIFQYLIAKLSRRISGLLPILGNRFIYVGKLPSHSNRLETFQEQVSK